MNRLWMRLSMSFSIVILLSILVMALFMDFVVRGLIEMPQWGNIAIDAKGDNTFLTEMTTYYQETGSWDGLGDFLEQPAKMVGDASEIVITNDSLKVLYGTSDAQTILETQWSFLHPIQVNGEVVGHLHVLPMPDRPEGGVLRYILPMAVVVCSTFGILAGVLVSHTLTIPLRNLAYAARKLGQQWRLEERIEVKGTVEVTELAGAFNDMVASLQEAEYLRQQLVTDVAHELRTPLNSIQGNLYAMLDDVYPLTKAEIAMLYDRTRGLIRLVEDLREVSRAESGQMAMHMEPVDLCPIIEQVVATIRDLNDEEAASIELMLPNDAIMVVGDRDRLSQVLRNVLSNSLNHIESGRIEVNAEQTSHGVVLLISDSGIGIPEKHLPFIFERFYRVDASRDRIQGGTGIGLSISRAIIHAHGGTITAQSPGLLGRGTTIRIDLPLEDRVADKG